MNTNTPAIQPQQAGHPPKPVTWSQMLKFLLVALFLPALLFLSAGTLDWIMAWLYLLLTVGITVISRLIMLRKHPDLIAERAHYREAAGAKEWDKALMPFIAIVGPLLILLVAGLNRRFGWPPEIPPALQLAGLAALVFGVAFSTWAVAANRFFAAVVRIQTDRGHIVVTTGPYRFVRHPGYVGGVVANLATPLMLGSAWALIPGLLVVGLTILRTSLEDKTLQAELPGYAEYAQRVRYRLVPGIW